jgi:hypothetical protein
MSLEILKNIKGFLERTEAKGLESYEWVKAHQFVMNLIEGLEKRPAPAQPPQAPTEK